MKKYIKPVIEEKECEISYFLTNSFFSDALGFFVGDVVYAQSGNGNCGGDSTGSNCNNSSCDLGSDGSSSNNNDNSSYGDSSSGSDSGGGGY